MDDNLFDHIDIDVKNINIPDGKIDKKSIDNYCKDYEKKLNQVEVLIFNY